MISAGGSLLKYLAQGGCPCVHLLIHSLCHQGLSAGQCAGATLSPGENTGQLPLPSAGLRILFVARVNSD